MSKEKPRLHNLGMGIREVIWSMTGGNVGAATVLLMIWQDGARIDRDSLDGATGIIKDLDDLDIYDDRIWKFYKDVAQQNVSHLIAILRAVQLGFITAESVAHAIDNSGAGLDVPDILQKVSRRLPGFVITKDATIN